MQIIGWTRVSVDYGVKEVISIASRICVRLRQRLRINLNRLPRRSAIGSPKEILHLLYRCVDGGFRIAYTLLGETGSREFLREGVTNALRHFHIVRFDHDQVVVHRGGTVKGDIGPGYSYIPDDAGFKIVQSPINSKKVHRIVEDVLQILDDLAAYGCLSDPFSNRS